MPSRGVDIIDGIPVYIKGAILYAFQSGVSLSNSNMRVGVYDTDKKLATWDKTDIITSWRDTYRAQLVPRSRK
jgi:hypothetical protein